MATALRNLALVQLQRRPEEAARILERCSGSEAAALLRHAAPDVSAGVLALVSPRFAARCFAALSAETRTAVLEELSPTGAAALLRHCPDDVREKSLAGVPPAVATPIRSALGFAPDSAGALAAADVLTLFADLPVERAVEILGVRRDAVPDRVVVLDRSRRVLGVLRIAALCLASRDSTVGSLRLESVPPISASTPVAALAGDRRWEGSLAPVVDRSRAFVGILNPESLRRDAGRESVHPATQLVVAFSELSWYGLTTVLALLAAGGRPADTGRRLG